MLVGEGLVLGLDLILELGDLMRSDLERALELGDLVLGLDKFFEYRLLSERTAS